MNITRGKLPGAKKIIVYGPEGIGKSTFASRFPDPVFIDTEGSTKDMDVARFDKAGSWAMILKQVRYVADNPGCCRTLVIDTADWAEQIEITSLCEEKGWKGIEDPGYGKGYTYCAEKFGEFLNLLGDVAENGVHVVMTAHAQMRKVELPEEMGAYDHWEMKTSKKTAPMIREWADAVFFANYKTRVIEVDKKKKAQGGQRVMYTSHTPFWDAKNRYGLPDELPFDYNSIRHIIEPDSKAGGFTKNMPDALPQEPMTTPRTGAGKQMGLPLGQPAPQPQEALEKEEARQAAEEKALDSALDLRIPKSLRDLMIADGIGEWDLQNVVNIRQPGVFPYDMLVKDYPEDFINEWILPNWKRIAKFAKEIRENEEIPFN